MLNVHIVFRNYFLHLFVNSSTLIDHNQQFLTLINIVMLIIQLIAYFVLKTSTESKQIVNEGVNDLLDSSNIINELYEMENYDWSLSEPTVTIDNYSTDTTDETFVQNDSNWITNESILQVNTSHYQHLKSFLFKQNVSNLTFITIDPNVNKTISEQLSEMD